MKIKGIDVSGYNGNINWSKVAENGVEFAILKVIRKDLTSILKQTGQEQQKLAFQCRAYIITATQPTQKRHRSMRKE